MRRQNKHAKREGQKLNGHKLKAVCGCNFRPDLFEGSAHKCRVFVAECSECFSRGVMLKQPCKGTRNDLFTCA